MNVFKFEGKSENKDKKVLCGNGPLNPFEYCSYYQNIIFDGIKSTQRDQRDQLTWRNSGCCFQWIELEKRGILFNIFCHI